MDGMVFLVQSFLCNSIDCTCNHSVRNGCLWCNGELSPGQGNGMKISETFMEEGVQEERKFQPPAKQNPGKHQQHKIWRSRSSPSKSNFLFRPGEKA